MTQLEHFITRNVLKPANVARAANCSRQHLLRLRKGDMDPTRGMMIAIARGCAFLVGRPVAVAELFEIESDVSARSS